MTRLMSVKDQRLQALRRIVASGGAGTQGELRRALRKLDLAVDQSTLSRDLVELGVRKSGGRYVFAEPAAPASPLDLHAEIAATVQRFTTCGPHLIVIHTVVGAAQPVSLAIDHANDGSIVATLAGDDTVFVATKSRRAQTVALRRLIQWFGDKHEL